MEMVKELLRQQSVLSRLEKYARRYSAWSQLGRPNGEGWFDEGLRYVTEPTLERLETLRKEAGIEKFRSVHLIATGISVSIWDWEFWPYVKEHQLTVYRGPGVTFMRDDPVIGVHFELKYNLWICTSTNAYAYQEYMLS